MSKFKVKFAQFIVSAPQVIGGIFLFSIIAFCVTGIIWECVNSFGLGSTLIGIACIVGAIATIVSLVFLHAWAEIVVNEYRAKLRQEEWERKWETNEEKERPREGTEEV